MPGAFVAGNPGKEQGWHGYIALMVFNIDGIALLCAIHKLQGALPFNPQGYAGIDTLLAFNTAVSFVATTNWQNYSGEATMSNFTQMAGLTVQNYLSAATGIAAAFACIAGFARGGAATIGIVWPDVTRVSLYQLLPASLILTFICIAPGVPQAFGASAIAVGPVASPLAVVAATTLFASIAAALAYNFFFLPPTYTLTIQDPQNIVTFLVLVGVGGKLEADPASPALLINEPGIGYRLEGG